MFGGEDPPTAGLVRSWFFGSPGDPSKGVAGKAGTGFCRMGTEIIRKPVGNAGAYLSLLAFPSPGKPSKAWSKATGSLSPTLAAAGLVAATRHGFLGRAAASGPGKSLSLCVAGCQETLAATLPSRVSVNGFSARATVSGAAAMLPVGSSGRCHPVDWGAVLGNVGVLPRIRPAALGRAGMLSAGRSINRERPSPDVNSESFGAGSFCQGVAIRSCACVKVRCVAAPSNRPSVGQVSAMIPSRVGLVAGAAATDGDRSASEAKVGSAFPAGSPGCAAPSSETAEPISRDVAQRKDGPIAIAAWRLRLRSSPWVCGICGVIPAAGTFCRSGR